MSARPIGEIIAPIVERTARLAGLQRLINDLPTAERRKEMIMAARVGGLISEEETQLLIEAHQLETA